MASTARHPPYSSRRAAARRWEAGRILSDVDINTHARFSMARGGKILTLSAEQHKLLGHALALAHAVHSQMGGNGLGVAPGELPAIYGDVDTQARLRTPRGGPAPCSAP